MHGSAEIRFGPAEVHWRERVPAHEGNILGHVVEGGFWLENEQVVAGEDPGISEGFQRRAHGCNIGPAIEVHSPIGRGVLDPDVHAHDPQPCKLTRKILGDRIGPALAHESRLPHALLIKGLAHGRDARQAVGRSRQ